MAAVEEEDPAQVRAAQILASLRCRTLRRPPEWVPIQPGQASTSAPDHVAAEVMRSGGASSARTVAAGVPLRKRTERVSMQSGDASSSLARAVAAWVPLRKRPERVSMEWGEPSFSLAGTVAARVPERWPKGKRSRAGETSREPEQGHAAAAKGSAASAQRQRPVVAALCFAAVAAAGSGSGPSTSANPGKEPMKTPSPDSTLNCGADGSGAPSSADDAAPAQAKRKGPGPASGSVGGENEGCSSPAKRGPVAQEEKPTPTSVEPSAQSETRASSAVPRPFDLNVPCSPDEDDDGCPDTT